MLPLPSALLPLPSLSLPLPTPPHTSPPLPFTAPAHPTPPLPTLLPRHPHHPHTQARSPVFRALLTGPMREGHESNIDIQDIRAPVFRALLYFAYTDSLPEDLQVGCSS